MKVSVTAQVKVIIKDGWRYTLGVSVSTAHGILKENGMSKVCARRVPHLLTGHDRNAD